MTKSLFRYVAILLAIISYAFFYLVFELHNAWPFNESVFGILRIITIVSLGASFAFVLIRKPAMAALSLVASSIAVSYLSFASFNPSVVVAQMIVAAIVYLLARGLPAATAS